MIGLLSRANSGRRSGGFTLVELLVVITIITMLAGMSLAVVYQTRAAARDWRTRTTISKLHRLVMERYASYRTRRVPLPISQLIQAFPRSQRATVAAQIRLAALRQLMRLELPDRFSDINPAEIGLKNDLVPIPWKNGSLTLPNGNPITMPLPAATRTYIAKLAQVDLTKHDPKTESAECLYLILCTGAKSSREQFADYEVADTDGDGLAEFIDGWGNPISWLRWAPAFADSDLQIPDPKAAHDPFDTRNVDPDAYRLIPLIYSNGPDGQSGINDGGASYVYDGNVYDDPLGSFTSGEWKDNIHNHQLEVVR